MNSQRGFWRPLIILILGMVVVAAIYWLRPVPKTKPVRPVSPPVVNVIEARPDAHQIFITTQGTVAPRREINLVAEVAGRVVAVADSFVDGGFFAAGNALVSLDDRDYRYTLFSAKAEVANAERERAIERGQARQAKREWRDLGNKEANALFLRKPQVAAADAQLAAAKAQRDKAELDLSRTKISAPFSGRVRTKEVDIGQYVSPGTVIARVYDSAAAEVRLPLNDAQLGLIDLPFGGAIDPQEQPKVVLSSMVAGKLHSWEATITRTEASVDTNTRFYYAIAEVAEPFNEQVHSLPLMIGLFVDATIAGREMDNMIAIPQKALLKRRQVFVVDANNRLSLRQVRWVNTDQDKAWVSGDFRQGERIVVSDPAVLSASMEVTPKLLSAPAANAAR